MKRFLKWALIVVLRAGRRAGFGAFLYFIPPFFITPPETFGKAMADAAPGGRPTSPIPAERAIAARGRYIVMTDRLHRLSRDQRLAGTRTLTKYLAGGALKFQTPRRHVRQPEPDARPGHRPRPPHRRRGEARAAQRHVPRRPRRRPAPRCRGRSFSQLERRRSPRGRRLPPASSSRSRTGFPIPVAAATPITIPGRDRAGLRAAKGLRPCRDSDVAAELVTPRHKR